MINIYYDCATYSEMLSVIAKNVKGKVTDGLLSIPAGLGSGYLRAVNLPNGISVLVSDTKFTEDVMLHRSNTAEHSYILQFNEAIEIPGKQTNEIPDAFSLVKQMVLLTHTEIPTKYFIPANYRLLSYRIIFKKEHLTENLDEKLVDEILTRYFSRFIKNAVIEPLDVNYRVILDEIIKEKIEHPLAINFLQNRSMLLIEKFLSKLVVERKAVYEKMKFSDNELVRLMKVESMLVKDFSVTPPNINYLSKVSAMSPTKLKTDFKKLYGMPIYEYYQKNRMQRAKTLLLHEKLSIKEVGAQVGYTNLSHFAGSFKKEFGMLPSQLSTKDKAMAV